ncbi:hypothetical protein [Bradyrhizobium septentrionale]|uniref:Uncharacterized protein n=1 Tax=Bradyrhizobium septentrionale TaxID=1404411 RepID=A0A973W4R2_9BRAD|nr:hypothetical protein [Bradyrhizobium septentrionale]UGY16256.1 hypothetical protein HAP48_0048640 [Bradyrhizobium septentrionale]UGY24890.1 hypothetical protein HU675_0044640 [Bradyrhizobium septentrionale]
MAGSDEIRIEYTYTIRITASSINLDTKYITAKHPLFEADRALGPCIEFSSRSAETLPSAPEIVGALQIA